MEHKMSVEIKTEHVEDEENLRATPERESIIAYKKANRNPDESLTSIGNVDKDRDSDNVVVKVKEEPQEDLGASNKVPKEIINEQVIEKMVAGTTMKQEQAKTLEHLEKIKSTELSNEKGKTTGLDMESVETTIEVPAGNENIEDPINNLTSSANKTVQISMPQVKTVPNTNTFESTRVNADNEQDKSNNSTPLENSDVSVKIEPGINVNDTTDFDMTIARPTSREVSKPLLETETREVNFNENTDLVDTPAVPPPPPTISPSQVRDPIDGTATPRITLAPMSSLRVKTEFSHTQIRQPNVDNEQDKSNNSTPLENSDVSVKTEPGINVNDSIDFDMTIARPASRQISDPLLETGTREVNFNENTDLIDTPAGPPPPPTIFPSQVRDPIDGTATPRITLAPMSRLRVKTEFSLTQIPQPNAEASALPSDFFDSLLSADKRSESGEISSADSDARSQDEPIPDNFFDDLLRDQMKERIEEAKNDELEEKYSDRLKELKKLSEKSRQRKKSHKKQKKSKKKSHKRSRSRSPPGSREKQRDHYSRSPSPNHSKNKRSRIIPNFQQLPSTSNYGNLNKVTKDGDSSIYTNHRLQVKSEFRTFETSKDTSLNRDFEMLLNPVKVKLPEVNCEEVVEVEKMLTPKQKRDRAMMRAATLVAHLTNETSDTKSLSTFQYTSTVRKLPASHSYVNQQIYENRSPLHTVNNVNYKFNTHATRFNMEEWGLATLPTKSTKIAKLIGCDALTIHNKLKTIKIPAKLQKNKKDANEQEEEDNEITSSFFCNVMTQTDDMEDFTQLKTKGYEVGIQVGPSVCNIGCQTLETQSPTKNPSNHDELPIMKIMHDLNENQLMAIHDFAELIKEPVANAMDMYALRMRMLEIYKCSQLPSALATPPTQAINNYTTNMSRNSPQSHRRPAQIRQPIIQSVSSADGSHYSVNDPRAKSAAYSSRGVAISSNGDRDSPSDYDPRYSAFTQPTSMESPSSLESRYATSSPTSMSGQRSSSHLPSSSTGRYYGRGGLRRK